MITVVGVVVAGGFGAVARFLLDGVIQVRAPGRYPVGTMVINLSGSLLLGVVVGLTLRHALSDPWPAILGSGFLGGYTTFSTASVETVRLLSQRRLGAALAHGLGMLVAAVLAAALGLWLGAR